MEDVGVTNAVDERSSPVATWRSGLPVMVAVLSVVVAATASLVFSQWRLRHIEDQALDIVEDAAPSIDQLSTARTELRRLGMYLNEYVAPVGDGRAISRDDIRATRNRLASAITAYGALPSFPGEHQHLGDIHGSLALLDEALAKALDETDANQPGESRRTVAHRIHPLIERTDDALARLKALNSDHAKERAESILRARWAAAQLAAVLGVGTLAVAFLATLLVMRMMRSRARLIAEHQRVLAARATELEAFAGRAAHDLKNPLAAIALKLVAATRRCEDASDLRDGLDRAGRQVERMNHIIDGLLEFARAGANPPPGARADLAEILTEVVEEVRPAAEAVQAELRVDAFPPTRLACSEGGLTSVISNLLDNAIKYIVEGRRDPRRISVRVQIVGARARVEIEDSGPGLPPGSEERVFEPFRRLRQTSQPGIGLGLATVKKIVEAYHGSVGVRSRFGEGCTFWFELPKAGDDAAVFPSSSAIHGAERIQPTA